MMYQTIGRRSALKYLSLLVGSAAGQNFLATWLPAASGSGNGHPQGAANSAAGLSTPQFFTLPEYRTVEMLTELIIPTDDQPGAREAQVARYIDFVVYSAAEFEPQLQREWTEGLAMLDALSRQKHNHSFCDLSTAQQETLLTEMSVPEHDPHAAHEGFAFYQRVKAMTVEGFYTSKVGLIDVLGYQGRAYLAEFPGCTHPEHQS